MESFWHEEASCWMHIIEADGWKLVIQENGKRGANVFLEGRIGRSERLGELTHSERGVDKFLQFMERFEKGKKQNAQNT